LTPCCGLEVQKPTQALQSVKGPGNTLDLNLKWARTLPSFIYFSWDIYKDPSSKLIFDTLLWGCRLEMQKSTQAFKTVK
jgi:hypothetical protein